MQPCWPIPIKALHRNKRRFASLFKGCHIQLERYAQEYILSNIQDSHTARTWLISRLASFFEDSGMPLTMANFLSYYHLDVRLIYKQDNFSRLSVQAGVRNDFHEPMEEVLAKAFRRICAIDSRRWISFLLDIFPRIEHIDLGMLTAAELRMLQMFQFTVWQKPFEECGFDNLIEGLIQIKNSPVLYEELIELLQYNLDCIDFIDEPVELGFECPLDLYRTYTRDQILVALDFMKPNTVREGVKYPTGKKLDVLRP